MDTSWRPLMLWEHFARSCEWPTRLSDLFGLGTVASWSHQEQQRERSQWNGARTHIAACSIYWILSSIGKTWSSEETHQDSPANLSRQSRHLLLKNVSQTFVHPSLHPGSWFPSWQRKRLSKHRLKPNTWPMNWKPNWHLPRPSLDRWIVEEDLKIDLFGCVMKKLPNFTK